MGCALGADWIQPRRLPGGEASPALDETRPDREQLPAQGLSDRRLRGVSFRG